MTAETSPDTPSEDVDALMMMQDLSAPHAGYLKLLDQGGFAAPMEGVVLVADRAMVDHVLRHHEIFSSKIELGLGNVRPLIPLNVDPPLHSKFRKLLDPLFSPHRMDEQEADIRNRVNALIDGFVDRGSCDAVGEFAALLPTTIFLDFLGLPGEHLPQFMQWENAILHPGPDGTHAGLTREQAQAAVRDYFADVIARRRATPPDATAHDLLADAMTWDLGDDDLLSFCLLMFAAGLDTVTAELGYGMLHLATHPADRAALVADPSIVDEVVEELMRVYPIAVPPRVVLQDTEVAGCPVERGDYVLMGLPGTGRHEGYHDDATAVDFGRRRMPNTTFGLGPHRCVGAHLARQELKVAYGEWHRRIPEYRVASGAPPVEAATLTLGLTSLPLEWDVP